MDMCCNCREKKEKEATRGEKLNSPLKIKKTPDHSTRREKKVPGENCIYYTNREAVRKGGKRLRMSREPSTYLGEKREKRMPQGESRRKKKRAKHFLSQTARGREKKTDQAERKDSELLSNQISFYEKERPKRRLNSKKRGAWGGKDRPGREGFQKRFGGGKRGKRKKTW